MGLLTILTGRGQAEIAQRAKTRELIEGIEALAPQYPNGIRYATTTLAGVLQERSGLGDKKISDVLVRTMGFAPDDHLSVYLPPRFRRDPPSSLRLERVPQLDRQVEFNFHPHTRRFNGYKIEAGGQVPLEPIRDSAMNKDQGTLVGVLQAIHDDLQERRGAWVTQSRLVRAAWVDNMSRPFAQIQRPIPRVDGMLLMTTNAFTDENFMVVGGFPDSAGNSDLGTVRLYTTLNIDEHAAAKMANSFSVYNRDDSEITYSRNLRAHAGQLRVRFGDGMQITLETFSPTIRRSRNEKLMPYLEPEFANFLAGLDDAFSFKGTSKTDSKEVSGVLLLRYRNSFGGQVLFGHGLEAPQAVPVAAGLN